MNLLESKCKGCVFAVLNNDGVQEGCKLNRLEKLNPTKKFDGQYQVCERYCTAYRPSEWIEEQSYPSTLSIEEMVLLEVRPRVGFVINFQYDLAELEKTLSSLAAQEYYIPRYIVIVNNKAEYNQEIDELITKYFTQKTICHIMQMLIDVDHQALLDHAFKFAKQGWICLIKAGHVFEENFLLKIHNRVNIELKRFLVAADEQKEKCIIFTPLFKFLCGNKAKMLQDGSVDNRGFYEKLKDIPNTDPESIIDWKDLFNE